MLQRHSLVFCLGSFALVAATGACVGGAAVERDRGRAEARETFDLPRTDPATCRGGLGPRLVRGAPATWTLLVYEAVDNNLEPFALDDIEQMRLGHGGSPSVSIAVQLDKASEDGMWRQEVVRDDASGEVVVREVEHSSEEPDSADARMLAAFGEWGVTCYPAAHTVLIVGGHGGGYSAHEVAAAGEARSRSARGKQVVRLIAPDDRTGTEMLVPDLARALATIRAFTEAQGGVLELYGSDACLMQTLEVASDLEGTASFIVGSEELEPGGGWPYSTILRDWTARPNVYADTPGDLGAAIVEAYGRSYSLHGGQGFERENTLAAIDASVVPRARDSLGRIATLLRALLALEPRLADVLWAAADASPRFSDVNVDMGSFLVDLRRRLVAEGLAPETGGRLGERDERFRTLRDELDALLGRPDADGAHEPGGLWTELVVRSSAGEAYPGAMGVSLYMPTEACSWSLEVPAYRAAPFSVATGWGDLVGELLEHHPHPVVQRFHANGQVHLTVGRRELDEVADCNVAGERIEIAPKPAGDEEEGGTSLSLSLRGTFTAEGGVVVPSAELTGESPDVDARFVARGERPPVALVLDRPATPGHMVVGRLELHAVHDRISGEDIAVTAEISCQRFRPTTYCDAVGAPPGF